MITDGVNGFLVNLGDISEAANKAVQLLQDEDLRQRFIENGFQTVEEKFGSAKILEQYEQLYYEVAGKV